jgi:hypothetical protein
MLKRMTDLINTLRLCKQCRLSRRKRGLAFCSDTCHTNWRVLDAIKRGYIMEDDYEGVAS